jgi:hypothetical protein
LENDGSKLSEYSEIVRMFDVQETKRKARKEFKE